MSDQRGIEAVWNHQIPVGAGTGPAVRLLHAELRDIARQIELGARIAQGDRGLGAEQRQLRAPAPGREAGEPELDGKVGARLLDERVDAGRERLEDPPALGVIAAPLPVIPGPAVAQQPGQPVVRQIVRAQDPGQLAGPDPAVHVHLPEPVLGLDVALREEKVVRGAGVDVGNAPTVPDHLDGVAQSGELGPALDAGERGFREGGEGALGEQQQRHPHGDLAKRGGA